MTVSSSTFSVSYAGDDATSELEFTFKIYADTDLIVIKKNDTSASEETLTLDSNYTVTRNADQEADPGGSITLTGDESPSESGYTYWLIRDIPNVQETNIEEGSNFPVETVEMIADKLTMQMQQAQNTGDRAFRLSIPDSEGVTLVLPAPEAGKTLVWNGSADALINAVVSSVLGASTDITDFPSTLEALKIAKVKSDASGWELVDYANVSLLADLSDFPAYSGTDRRTLREKASNDGIEFADFASPFNVQSCVNSGSPYTLDVNDCIVLCDCSDGAITLNLPDVSTLLKQLLIVTKKDGTTNEVTITPNGTDTIDGYASATLADQDESIILVAQSGVWKRVKKETTIREGGFTQADEFSVPTNGAWQGVAVDTDNEKLYVLTSLDTGSSEENIIRVYDYDGNLLDTKNDAYDPGAGSPFYYFSDGNIIDGELFVTTRAYPNSRVAVFDLSDLSLDRDYDISANVTIAEGIQKHGGKFWVVEGNLQKGAKIHRYDSSFNWEAEYELTAGTDPATTESGDKYQGLDIITHPRYGVLFIMNIHAGTSPEKVDVYQYKTNHFELLERFEPPTNCNQGHCYDSVNDVWWFADRITHKVHKATLIMPENNTYRFHVSFLNTTNVDVSDDYNSVVNLSGKYAYPTNLNKYVPFTANLPSRIKGKSVKIKQAIFHLNAQNDAAYVSNITLRQIIGEGSAVDIFAKTGTFGQGYTGDFAIDAVITDAGYAVTDLPFYGYIIETGATSQDDIRFYGATFVLEEQPE